MLTITFYPTHLSKNYYNCFFVIFLSSPQIKHTLFLPFGYESSVYNFIHSLAQTSNALAPLLFSSLQQNWNPEGTSAFSTAAHACPAVAQITASIQIYSQMAGPETSIWMQEVHLGGKPRKQSEGMREAKL